MMRKGKWCGPYAKKKNCGKCRECKGNKHLKPHGVYWYMARRNPATGRIEQVSFGRNEPTPEMIAVLNSYFGDSEKPTRDDIKDMDAFR